MSERYKTVRRERYLRRTYLCRLAIWIAYPAIVAYNLWDAYRDGVSAWAWIFILITLWVWWSVDRMLLRMMCRWEIAAEVRPLDPVGDPDLYEYVASETVRRLAHADLDLVRELRRWFRDHDVTQVAAEDRPHRVTQFVAACEIIAREMLRRKPA